jgi:hypothetical protein
VARHHDGDRVVADGLPDGATPVVAPVPAPPAGGVAKR